MDSNFYSSNSNPKMNDSICYCLLIVGIIAILWFSGIFNPRRENYQPMTQNFNYTNKNDIANKLEYGEIEEPALNPKGDNQVMGPNSNYGVNKNYKKINL